MTKTKLLYLALLLLLISGHASTQHVAAQSAQDIVGSSLVFRGTVTKIQATTMKMVAASPNTIVVKVETVLRTNDPSSDYKGKEITVYLKDPNSLKVGDTAVFYTQGWLLEESVAVREIAHTKLNAKASSQTLSKQLSMVSNGILTTLQTEGNKALQQRFANANLVVEGKVVSTERVDILPSGVVAGDQPSQLLFSEHNPLLKKAVIEVSSVLNSADGSQPKTITVLYPTSQDVAWADAPVFKVGDAGLFILDKAQANLALREFLNDAKGKIEGLEKSYIGIDRLDFHPRSDIERIKPMIKLNSPKPHH